MWKNVLRQTFVAATAFALMSSTVLAAEVDAPSYSEDALAAQEFDDRLTVLTWAVEELQNRLNEQAVIINEQSATINHQAEEIASLSEPNCPTGYTLDASRTDIVLCIRGADEMVQVGDFWVDRYEASVWANEDCTGTQFGVSGDDYPSSFPDNGNVPAAEFRLFACSVAGVTPSRSLTWFQAQQACVASGKHLITNVEWQAAAAGTYDPGAFDGSYYAGCNTDSSEDGPRVTGSAGTTPGGYGSCISVHGVEDMVGNLWEWTAAWYVAGVDWQGSDGSSTADAWPEGYGSDRTYNVNGRAYNGSAWVDGLPAAACRGGYWGYGTAAGVFAVGLGHGPSHRYTRIGARCARRQ